MLNTKEIKKLIKLCRSQGIKTVKYGDIELTLGEAPAPKARKADAQESSTEYTTDIPTAEQMQFWSVTDVGTNEGN
jgi:hypothetical protein